MQHHILWKLIEHHIPFNSIPQQHISATWLTSLHYEWNSWWTYFI